MPRPLIIFCDGTWCGRETNTQSNIYQLARIVGVDIDDPTDTDSHCLDDKAWYMHGVGLGSTFIDYVFDGVTGQDLAAQCIDAYKFIVKHYTYPEREIWMFGLSRGAYLVRSVAGMINNCGIVKPVLNRDGTVNDDETDLLCHQVYRIYRSDDPINCPHTAQSLRFRRNASWPLIGDEAPGTPQLRPPIKFMGLFDTVGSLGIPNYVGGVGMDWPQFHDQNVSTVVELVYHALSLHDRFYIFPPCLAKRKPLADRPDNFGITQKWFPGAHYDLGRQRFRFLRLFGGGLLERLLARWTWASREIRPNEVLSDLVLKWMLEAMKAHDGNGGVVPRSRYDEEIEAAAQRMLSPTRQRGDGDVYEMIVSYVPFGGLIFGLLTRFSGKKWQMSQLYQLFFALRDRVVADLDSQVYDYDEVDPSLGKHGHDAQTVGALADVTVVRYPSRAFAAWRLCCRVLGVQSE
ncbi:hypothetical protein NOR_01650 [Metarhizium rileyi]|uniref:T6SS Phospholipase effector Tle1-like catalytic domain-containing protein n=1 Tax=Metarhizium rileyi (strain RCEF 4871) TaxID=1649241 RepID=A0A162M0W8_METRR|nr:hypothetical protein NOR_01650 [Metarhizium rileyi RCEF 4871]